LRLPEKDFAVNMAMAPAGSTCQLSQTQRLARLGKASVRRTLRAIMIYANH
jgi:hypothetical protein